MGTVFSYPFDRILSCGLLVVYQLIRASTFESRSQILNAKYFKLTPTNKSISHLLLFTRLPNPRQLAPQNFSSYYNDPDPGPAEAFVCLYPARFNPRYRDTLYKWGYVMWNQDRIRNLAHFSYSGPNANFNPSGVYPTIVSTLSSLETSWKRRTEIYYKGGRGWWDSGDESRVIWNNPIPPSSELRPRWIIPPDDRVYQPPFTPSARLEWEEFDKSLERSGNRRDDFVSEEYVSRTIEAIEQGHGCFLSCSPK